MGNLKQLVKSKFDYDVSELSAYVDENDLNLVTRAVTEGRTLELIDIRTGIKGTQQIPLMSDEINYQSADACGFNAEGDTEFDTTDLTVVPMKIEKQFCNEDLVGFFTQQALRQGVQAGQEELPFGDAITNHILRLHSNAFDSLLWQGDTNNSTGNLSFFDGFGTLFDASADVVNATASVAFAAVNATNAYNVFTGIYNEMVAANEDVAFSDDFVLFCNMSYLQSLKLDMVKKNLFAYSSEELQQGNFRVRLAGTNCTVVGVPGLKNNTSIYGGRTSKMIFGTDGANDLLSFRLWYSEDDDVIKMSIKFRAGVTVPYFDEFVKWSPSGSPSA
jgi:hypothetical protein